MPTIAEKEKDLKEFIKLTWEVVRRNQEYQADYKRFRENNPVEMRRSKFDLNRRRHVWDDEDVPDTVCCNLSYMMQRWGFAWDPDKQLHPVGSYWLGGLFSKEAQKQKREALDPLLIEQTELRKLPGVLEVKAWPDLKQTEESIQKQQEALKSVLEGWQPQCQQEQQEFEAATEGQWEIEDPPYLTVSINLRAPSYLAKYALEFLNKICKAGLDIKEKKIERQYIEKCL